MQLEAFFDSLISREVPCTRSDKDSTKLSGCKMYVCIVPVCELLFFLDKKDVQKSFD